MIPQKLNHFVESQQLSPELISHLFKQADKFRKLQEEGKLKSLRPLDGKILIAAFYEPSTRTRFSFESAMLRMGGKVISSENAGEFSSAVKGETIEDTIRVLDDFGDCIVMRHKEDGIAKKASALSQVPVINAGDGKGQHPTQSLLDVYTINREIGRLDNLNVAMIGDLANGRTARSLCYLLSKYKRNKITFISPESLGMRDDIKHHLQMHETSYKESDEFHSILPEVDVIYMTRIQKERMPPEQYEKVKGKFIFGLPELLKMKKEARVMHPLPKVDELNLSLEVEQEDRRVAYFRQAENGVPVRMALLNHLINGK